MKQRITDAANAGYVGNMGQWLTGVNQWVNSIGKMVTGKIVTTKMLTIMLFIGLWVSNVSPSQASGVYDFPATVDDSAWVFDEADILSRLTEMNLSQSLDSLSKKTGNEVRLVTIHRLDYGETIESFTNELFTTWFPSPDTQANQVVLALDNVTNNAAIRTGDGIKTLMADDIAASVAQETLMVPIRDGDKYNQAFSDVRDRLVTVLSGEPDPGPPVVEDNIRTEGTFASPEETKESNATFWVITLLILATIIPMATYYFYQMQG
jgi:uncharacterized protein